MGLGGNNNSNIRIVCAANSSNQFSESHEDVGLELAVQSVHNDRNRHRVHSHEIGQPNPQEAPIDSCRAVARVQPKRIVPGFCEPRFRNRRLPTPCEPLQDHQAFRCGMYGVHDRLTREMATHPYLIPHCL